MTKQIDTEAVNVVLKKYGSHPMFSNREGINVNSCGMDGDSVLHKAVVLGDVESVCILLEACADPNFLGDMGYTPLHEAVEKDDIAIVEALLLAGASPIVRSEFGQSPLDIAILKGRGDIVALLRSYATE